MDLNAAAVFKARPIIYRTLYIIQQIFPPGDEKTSIEYFSLKANYCSSITIICFMIYVSFWKNLGHFWLFNRSIFQLKLTQTKQVSFFSFS